MDDEYHIEDQRQYISLIAQNIFSRLNEDGLLDVFGLEGFKMILNWNYEELENQLLECLENGLFFEKRVTEWIEKEKRYYAKLYDGCKPKDLVYYDKEGKPINDENATQKQFISLLNQFIDEFYFIFCGNIKRAYEESLLQYDDEEITPSFQNTNIDASKLIWKGTPAQFGFIIDLLIQGGYLEKPTSSFEKDANFYFEHFQITTTIKTLAKELSENTNSMETKNRNKFSIPGKDKLA